MDLTPHFTLEAMTFSDKAARAGVANTPTVEQIENLKRLCLKLEEVRVLLGNNPIFVSSGYRSPAVNKLAGGAEYPPSQHMQGLAADFVCRNFGNPYKVCQTIMDSGIEFDQMIYEYASWTHLSIPAIGHKARREVLTKKATVIGYQKGLIL